MGPFFIYLDFQRPKFKVGIACGDEFVKGLKVQKPKTKVQSWYRLRR
jgi:hypothetical protein